MASESCKQFDTQIDELTQKIQGLRTQKQQEKCVNSSVTSEGSGSKMTLQELMNQAMNSYTKLDIQTCSEDNNYRDLQSKIDEIGREVKTTDDVEKYVQPIFEKIFEDKSTVDFLNKCNILKKIVSFLLMISFKYKTDITIKREPNGSIKYIIQKGQFQKLIDIMNPIFYNGKSIDYSINSLYQVLLKLRKAKEPGMFGRGGRTRRYRKGKRTTTKRSRLAKVTNRYKRYKNKSKNQKRR
jgi:hypothetical protein